jgi:hypothetical protein
MVRYAVLALLVGCASEAPPAEAPAPSEGHAAEAPAAAATAEAGPQHFGEAFTVQETLPAKTLLADPSAHVGKTVRVEGRIADVCQKKGCWLVLTDEEKNLRVTMKDHAFGVDMGSAGATAVIEGTLVEKANDPEEAAHYASESKNPDAMPEKSAGEKKFELVATAVEIKRS